MTQTPDTFQNLTDEQIEEIIAKVEASKPWSGWLLSIEMFYASLFYKLSFTLIGMHIALSLAIARIYPLTISMFVITPFVIMDFYFFLKPNKFSKMTVSDWTRSFLTHTDFNQEKGYDHLKWTTIIYIICVFIVILFSKNIWINYIIYISFLTIMTFWYRYYNLFGFKSKINNDSDFWRTANSITETKRPISSLIPLFTYLLVGLFWFRPIEYNIAVWQWFGLYLIIPIFYFIWITFFHIKRKISLIGSELQKYQSYNFRGFLHDNK
jgi:hypothetical protein